VIDLLAIVGVGVGGFSATSLGYLLTHPDALTRARGRELPHHNLALPEVREDEDIKLLEQQYVDGKIETVEELDRRVSLILDPVARAEEEARKQYQSDWVMAIHHNDMLDQIAEQRRLDEEYFFEHGKPRPKPVIVQPEMHRTASAYVTAVSHGWGSHAAPLTISPARFIDVRPVDNRPRWAKEAEKQRIQQQAIGQLAKPRAIPKAIMQADWDDEFLKEHSRLVRSIGAGCTLTG
jgi:hypothetical protein